jgi:pimeloyl-ACP methyl ester carboxylesterase
MKRKFTTTFLLMFCGCSGLHKPVPHTGPACYVLYGAGGAPFSRLQSLQQLPVRVVIGDHVRWREFAKDAALNDGPIYIVGHSAGAAAATSMARKLNENGKQVEKLFLIDISPPIFPDWVASAIPPNVATCYWWQTGKPNRERPVPETGNNSTRFRQMNAGGHDHLGVAKFAAEQILKDSLIP